jgi:hypothetical protein
MKVMVCTVCVLLAFFAVPQGIKKEADPESKRNAAPPAKLQAPRADAKTLGELRAEVETLIATADVPWRQIAWESCLLNGLKESGAKQKPLLLWVFIDRPADDRRC